MSQNETEIRGLSSAEVSARVAAGKVNGKQNIKTKSVAEIVVTNAFTFFNLLVLIFAGIIIIFDLGVNQMGFVLIVLFNLFIGIFQELKAKRTIDKLSLLSAPKVRAVRDGVQKDIALKDIVLDETILLETGNQICADSTIIEGAIEVNESLLTGEPDAVTKNVGDEIYSGSFVVSGRAVSRAIRVGKENYATKISSGAKYIKKNNSQVLRSLMRFIKLMTIFIIPLGIALFTVKFFADGNLKGALTDTLTSLISMIPSGLIFLTSAVFAVSVVRLSKHKALAQDLYAAEALARIDVLCLDKTGTITEGSMEVAGILPTSGSEEDFKRFLKDLTAATADNNPTADAIEKYVENLEVTEIASSAIPFSSARKWSGANFKDGGRVIGAAEFVFKDNPPEGMKEYIKEQSEKGVRVLVAARCASPVSNDSLEAPELAGYLLITDKVRKEAPDTLRYFAKQGVTIKIISGDNPVTVKSIAERAGLEDAANFVDATTLSEEDIPEAAQKYSVFGRVTPEQKLALVKALKNAGHTVAMTGDGVNDVLALKESDCSVAMAAGSDAAKNVAQIVLLDSNFASMPKVVAEGRRSINNLERSASLFLVKSIYSLLVAFFLFIPGTSLPYSLINLTLLSGLTVGLPSFILALEPNKERVTGKFLDKIIAKALPGALSMFLVIVGMSLIYMLSPSIKGAISDKEITLGFSAMIDAFKGLLPVDKALFQFQSTCLIAMAFVSFMFLFRLCWRFNTIRIVMYAVLLSAFVAVFFIPPFRVFFALASYLPLTSIWLILGSVAVTVPVFILITRLTRPLAEKGLIDGFLNKLEIKVNKLSSRIFKKRKVRGNG